MKRKLFVLYGENAGKFRHEILNQGGFFCSKIGEYLMFNVDNNSFRGLAKQLQIWIRPLTQKEKLLYDSTISEPKKREKKDDKHSGKESRSRRDNKKC